MTVQIDWFQMYFRGFFEKSRYFSATPSGIRSKIFATVDNLTFKDKFFGNLCSKPLSPIIPEDSFILKVDNRILYDPDFENIYDNFKMFCGLKFQNITRLDVATDFNSFYHFRDPENFIKSFICGDAVYPGKSLFKIIGRTGRIPVFDYLRFGSNLSENSAYLYRKSLEMKQVKFKSWIYESWKRQGIDTKKDVWRLEFSLKGGHHYLYDQRSKEKIIINDNLCFDDNLLITLFESLISKYFTFRINEKDKRIDKLINLQLFDMFDSGYSHKTFSEHEEINRSQKIFIKQLEKLNSEVREYNSDLAYKIMEVSAHVAERTGLGKYREFISSK